MDTEKSRESKFRRMLKSAGYDLHKSRVRNPHLDDLGGYCITCPTLNAVIAGSRFELSLDDVAEWAITLI